MVNANWFIFKYKAIKNKSLFSEDLAIGRILSIDKSQIGTDLMFSEVDDQTDLMNTDQGLFNLPVAQNPFCWYKSSPKSVNFSTRRQKK